MKDLHMLKKPGIKKLYLKYYLYILHFIQKSDVHHINHSSNIIKPVHRFLNVGWGNVKDITTRLI